VGVALDSNVLVRYFTLDDAKLGPQAERIIDTAQASSLVLDRIIFAEVGYMLRAVYGFKKEQAVPLYQWLLNSSKFSIIERDLVKLTINLFADEAPLSFEDCWLLALKRAGKVDDVLTFDAALQKRVGR
jgi:predicted nucleic-acid-binding protein